MSGDAPVAMTSNRPYLLRAMYEWIADNGMSAHLLVDAQVPGVRVPASAIRDGKVVLNVAPRAITQLQMGNDSIHFLARFGGVSQSIELPVAAIQAIYAQETGQGMMMPAEAPADAAATGPVAVSEADDSPGQPPEPPRRGPHLRVVK